MTDICHPFCENTPDDVDVYIHNQPIAHQETLKRVKSLIQGLVPEAKVCIKWQMPTFVLKENLIHFACQKKHLGIYPGDEAVRSFAEELQHRGLTFSKGAIQLPWKEAIPFDLIEALTLHRVATVKAKYKIQT